MPEPELGKTHARSAEDAGGKNRRSKPEVRLFPSVVGIPLRLLHKCTVTHVHLYRAALTQSNTGSTASAKPLSDSAVELFVRVTQADTEELRKYDRLSHRCKINAAANADTATVLLACELFKCSNNTE